MNLIQVLVGWGLASVVFGLGWVYGSRKVAELREANQVLGKVVMAQADYIDQLEHTSAADELAREFERFMGEGS